MTTCSEQRRRRFGGLVACFVASLAAVASGHDFMLWPDAPTVARAGTSIDVGFAVGHDGNYDPWPHGLNKLERLGLVTPDGTERDLTSAVRAVGVTVVPAQAGSHVLLLESSPSTSKLDAERFDAYVADEGLRAIARHRRGTGATGPGLERYSRRAKTLLQVGERIDEAIVTMDYGLTLELIPLAHPLALDDGEALPVAVRFRGEPLPGARVRLESLSQTALGERVATTDASGRVAFAVPATGTWKLNVVWGVPSADGDGYDTIFSSLTFGHSVPGER